MTASGLTADQLNAKLIEIDETAGFEVTFSGITFIARNQYGKQVRGTLSATPLANSQALARVINTLRWPMGPRAEVKNKPFKGPPLDPRERFVARLELLKKRGREDERTRHWREVQAEHGLPPLPGGITYEPTWLTPKMAEEFLLTFGGLNLEDGRPAQRPLSDDRVKKYVETALSKGWGLSPDPLAYAKGVPGKGPRGINGQHRAAMCVYTGLTIPVMVSHGWDDYKTFQYLDKVLTRTTATTLALKGERNAPAMSASATLLAKVEKEPSVPAWTTKLRVEEAEVLQVVEDRPMLRQAVHWAASGTPVFLHRNALAVARCLAAEQCGPLSPETGLPVGDWDATAEFFNGLQRGGGLEELMPAFAIREYFSMAGKGSSPRISDKREIDKGGYHTFAFVSGWNLHVRREKLGRPTWKVSQMSVPKALRPRDLEPIRVSVVRNP